ncbi:MAG: hypothetical protein ABIT81_11510, partial [Ferruginibacter sp.]
MKNLFTSRYLVLLILATVSVAGLKAQISITTTGSSYTQNFDVLAQSGTTNAWTDNSTILGWYSNRTVYTGDNGAGTSGSLYSYGTTATSDRAIGALTSGTTPTVNIGVRILNNTGGAISGFTISFKGEQWRQTANAQALTFDYQVGATSLTTGTWTPNSAFTFTAPKTGTAGALDGNLAGNFTNIAGTLTAALNNGQEIWLRWTKTGTTSPGLGIDDINIIANSGTSSDANLSNLSLSSG